MLEEVETVKKEGAITPTQAEEIPSNATTTQYNPKVTEELAEADRKNLTQAVIEENPDKPTQAEGAIDSVTSGTPGVDLEERTRQVAGVDYNLGPNRPNVPEGDIVGQVRDAVS